MKKILLSIFTISALGVNAQIVNIPDANFKTYLVGNSAINTNADAEIQVSEASAFTGTINCANLSISDLTGIEAFTGATGLYCNNNSLTSLDVTLNTALTTLFCGYNNLINLDVTLNTALTVLYCDNNSLTSLDVTQNTALSSLWCSTNSLSSLDVTQNTLLTELECVWNNLTTLNVANGNNPGLIYFSALYNSSLTCIQVDDIAYSTTNWTNIDVGASFSLSCGPCTVTIPDANFKAYLVGNASINTNADTEIQCSEASSFTGTIDCQSLSISDLTGIEAFVLLDNLNCQTNLLTSINITQNTALTTLTCSGNSLTGLDLSANTALTTLVCSVCSLTSLDVSQNILLNTLLCVNNQLNTLDVSTNTALVQLKCNMNSLNGLDVSPNTILTTLWCQENQLTTLDVSNGNNVNFTSFAAMLNPNLTCIQVDDAAWSTTNWTNIDAGASFSTNCSACIVTIPDANFKTYLVGNTAINTNADTEIQCSEATAFTGMINCPNLSISDLTGIEAFTAITELHCNGNSLTSLDVSQNVNITLLNCPFNQLSSLDISDNTALQFVYCNDNSLTTLDVSLNTSLYSLNCRNNLLTTLDVQNTVIESLFCDDNNITSISINTGLVDLYCTNNSLTSLDVSQATLLIYLDLGANSLTSLNVANGNNTNFTTFNTVNNTGLSCIEVDDAAYSTTNWTVAGGNIDATSSFSTDCTIWNEINEEIENEMMIYPNPATTQINIEIEKVIESVKIFNIAGELVMSTNKNTFSVSSLSNGVYVMNIQTSNGVSFSKFIKE